MLHLVRWQAAARLLSAVGAQVQVRCCLLKVCCKHCAGRLLRVTCQLQKRKERVRACAAKLLCRALLGFLFCLLGSTLPVWGCGPTAGRRFHMCLRFQIFAVLSRFAQQAVLSSFAPTTLQEEELVCVATDEEAIKAYRAALQTALDGPSAAHPTEGFGDDDLSLSQAGHIAVRPGSVAGHASCYPSCAVHRG